MENNRGQIGPLYMPDENGGFIPAPYILTESELIRFLRLDVDGPQKPGLTIRHYRETGKLKGKKIGKKLRYPQKNIMDFLAKDS